MKKRLLLAVLLGCVAVSQLAWRAGNIGISPYRLGYAKRLDALRAAQDTLIRQIAYADISTDAGKNAVRMRIHAARRAMKGADFWLRYLEPLAYKKVNGPLPVEWETEVFEKFENPYRREGAGLTLAWNYLGEDGAIPDSLRALVTASQNALAVYSSDSITSQLSSYHVFYLCNRLYLLNLAAIYTTGFECPDAESVIPELREMMANVADIYSAFNASFPKQALSPEYLARYNAAVAFANNQPVGVEAFDHFLFIKDYVNPLYGLNQQAMGVHGVLSRSLVDYSLNSDAASIFDKGLYFGQNAKGIFRRVKDKDALAEIDRVGKLLYYDPILSGNDLRACASCHKPTHYFTDTAVRTSFHFNHSEFLPRNAPSLIGALYNHLLMLDGKHYTLQHQSLGVIGNAVEMSGPGGDTILQKVLQCKEYKIAFNSLLKYTPGETAVTMEHLASAITFYYAKFSAYYAPFDDAMNYGIPLEPAAVAGFNIFMGKAQCATCHFAPQFNGVKPPYIGSEFEVLGTPQDTSYSAISPDMGRWDLNPAKETAHAFRTGTIRNASRTAPYMHNGAFRTLDELIDFYDGGGGAGRGLDVPNQTLSADSLHLTPAEKSNLKAFILSLDERIELEAPPTSLPKSKKNSLNKRPIGGAY
jgi:cytochrome c peroxidase